MQKRWVLKEKGDDSSVIQLANALQGGNEDSNVYTIIANILIQRDIVNYDDAKHFFRPDIANLHDPFLMKDMYSAVDRIETAISNNEKILVYGDYDVDGTTAVALVYSFFKTQNANLDYYIPDRYDEGYGISYKGIDFAKENDFTLIIALDCGIKAVENIQYEKNNGIDFIVFDHHTPDVILPPAIAILNPKRIDCSYPFNELSGCGIGFKLVCAFAAKNKISFEEVEKYIDLVATSTASDIVPIIGENRILVHYGLKKINAHPGVWIKSLLKTARFEKELNVSDLVFVIAPRINAAGRIEHGKLAVELLIEEDERIADIKSENINQNNLFRKDLDKQTTQHALELIESDRKLMQAKTTVLYHDEWHKGVLGIVASRLTEVYYRPTVVLTKSNGLLTGSARSVNHFDVYQAIEKCSDLLEQFGGHKYAAGITMKPENLPVFQNRFEQVVSESIEECLLIPEIAIDAEITLEEITSKLYRIQKQFSPFGPGNMRPVFITKGVVDSGYAKVVGGNHLKMSVFHPSQSNFKIPAIAFEQAEHFEYVASGNPFDIAYTLGERIWNGEVTLQLKVKEIRY